MSATGYDWISSPGFALDGEEFPVTLRFVAGLAFGLNVALDRAALRGDPRLYCLPENREIDVPLLFDLLNGRLEGVQTAAAIAEAAAIALAEKYGC